MPRWVGIVRKQMHPFVGFAATSPKRGRLNEMVRYPFAPVGGRVKNGIRLLRFAFGGKMVLGVPR